MPKSSTTEFIARGVLVQDGRVLLCQNLKHGYTYLPGGHIEFAEPGQEALKREMLEECGQSVEVGRLLLLGLKRMFTASIILFRDLAWKAF